MRWILLPVLLLPIGCRNAADARYIAKFREDGIRACMSGGETLMRPHWHVPPTWQTASNRWQSASPMCVVPTVHPLSTLQPHPVSGQTNVVCPTVMG